MGVRKVAQAATHKSSEPERQNMGGHPKAPALHDTPKASVQSDGHT